MPPLLTFKKVKDKTFFLPAFSYDVKSHPLAINLFKQINALKCQRKSK